MTPTLEQIRDYIKFYNSIDNKTIRNFLDRGTAWNEGKRYLDKLNLLGNQIKITDTMKWIEQTVKTLAEEDETANREELKRIIEDVLADKDRKLAQAAKEMEMNEEFHRIDELEDCEGTY